MNNNSKTFLCEIGCEELPAKSLIKLAENLKSCVAKQLNDLQLDFEKIDIYATPRRLAVSVKKLDCKQQDVSTLRKGPRYAAAYDSTGAPTLACIGFAKSCNTSVDKLEKTTIGKDEFVACTINTHGEDTIKLLPNIMSNAIAQLQISKPMRWGSGSITFARPVHWVVMLFGNEPINAALFGINSSTETRGHRFHRPEHLHIKSADEYLDVLARTGFVLADLNYRRQQIEQQIKKLAPGCEAIYDNDLLDEVTCLVEWPQAILCQFSEEFLSLPPEVLITSLHSHQKCFPLRGPDGKLTSKFIVISNIEAQNPKKIIKGNEKVIHARLHDAKFFYDADLKTPLDKFAARLNKVIFQESLGTVQEKVNRVEKLATMLAAQMQADLSATQRAAELCKADLLTDMVGEFPSLQGIMGEYYAAAGGENPAACLAIREHYLPRFAGDELPTSATGACLAIADRLDTIVSIIAIGRLPTGDKDPFALRRAAAGILRIVFAFNWQFDIYEMCRTAIDALPAGLSNKDCLMQSASFILERLRSWSVESGFSSEEYNAVSQKNIWECLDFAARLEALHEFCALDASKSLAAAHKRVNNILRKNNITDNNTVNREQLKDENALILYDALQNIGSTDLNYNSLLQSLASLNGPVDNFFEKVMVMDDDQEVRKNRLALLQMLHNRLSEVADIRCLSI
jgi:glycyl-tRNA synthetase beta chain